MPYQLIRDPSRDLETPDLPSNFEHKVNHFKEIMQQSENGRTTINRLSFLSNGGDIGCVFDDSSCYQEWNPAIWEKLLKRLGYIRVGSSFYEENLVGMTHTEPFNEPANFEQTVDHFKKIMQQSTGCHIITLNTLTFLANGGDVNHTGYRVHNWEGWNSAAWEEVLKRLGYKREMRHFTKKD